MCAQKHEAITPVSKLFAGWLAAVILLLAGTGILSMLVTRNTVTESGVSYGKVMIVLLSSTVGSIVAIRTNKSRKIIVAAIFAILLWCSLLGITALFFEGRYDGVGVTLLLIMAGSLLPVLLGAGHRKQHHSVSRYARNR